MEQISLDELQIDLGNEIGLKKSSAQITNVGAAPRRECRMYTMRTKKS